MIIMRNPCRCACRTCRGEDGVRGAAQLQEDCGIERVEQEELAEDRLGCRAGCLGDVRRQRQRISRPEEEHGLAGGGENRRILHRQTRTHKPHLPQAPPLSAVEDLHLRIRQSQLAVCMRVNEMLMRCTPS